jgi:hypothetical protein
MVTFKKKSVGLDSMGIKHFYLEAEGLPAGVRCQCWPEEADRPRGEWFVVATKAGRKRVIRCESMDAASEAAKQWCVRATTKKKGDK